MALDVGVFPCEDSRKLEPQGCTKATRKDINCYRGEHGEWTSQILL